MSKESKAYTIEIPKLKLGHHQQEFRVDGTFLENHPDIQNADIRASLRIERTTMHLDIQYHLAGSVELLCDRCLVPYDYPIDATTNVVYSFDKAMSEADDSEVVFIPRSIHLLDVSQDLYDFIILQVPYRHVPDDCPRPSCPSDVLNLIGVSDTEEEEAIDPRWEALKGLLPPTNDR